MSDLVAGALLVLAFAAVIYLAFTVSIFVSIWLLPLVIIGGAGGVAALGWKLAQRD